MERLNGDFSNQLSDILYIMLTAIRCYAVDNFDGNLRVNEVSGTNLYGSGACQQKFDGVCGVHDASQADDGNFHRFVNLPNHAQGNRFDGCAAQSAGDG